MIERILEQQQQAIVAAQSSDPLQGLWESFDKRVAQASSSRTSSTEANVESEQYFQEKNIPRSECALD